MTAALPREALRALVREVLAESLPRPHADPAVEVVTLADDGDLDRLVRHLLDLFEDTEVRADIRSGALRFRLSGPPPGTRPAAARQPAPEAAPEPVVERIDKGAVTEARVRAAARSGATLVLGRSAVLTPLARDAARALRVVVEKER